MHIIPVIDLSRGQVVHAIRGQRADYRPVVSTLCKDSDPVTIVQAFLDLFAFDTLYMADLDAIGGMPGNRQIINDISERFPQLQLWLDAGETCLDSLPDNHGTTPIIGSETGVSPDELAVSENERDRFVLSLDFRDGQFLGNNALLENPATWPGKVIIMDLSRVGSKTGPGLALINDIQKHAGNRKIYCGGGIRSVEDLQQLSVCRVHGALLATALHDGTLDHATLTEIS